MVLLFGELLPKYFGLLYNEQISLAMVQVFDLLQKIVTPFRYVLTVVADFFSRLFFFFMQPEKPLTRGELEHALNASQNQGLLHSDEVSFVRGYLGLEEQQVKDVMIPRNDVLFYSLSAPLSKLSHLLTQLAEVLVCKNQDEPIGIMLAKDYFINKPKITSPMDILPFIRKPFYIPETANTKVLLLELLQQGKQSAVAVDEYGAFSGLVTRKEVLEQLNVEQTKETAEDYTHVSKQAIVACGKMSLQDLRKLFDVPLASDHHTITVAGYVVEQLDNIPKNGEIFEKDGVLFRVLIAEPTHIVKLFIQKQKPLRHGVK